MSGQPQPSESQSGDEHRRRSPIPAWISAYRRSDFPRDLLAAATVTLLLVPQGLAYAALAGLPPHVGLYASLLPLVAYALSGSSTVMSVGPVAVIGLMTATALAPVAPPGSPAYLAAAVLLATLCGLISLVFGYLRLGAMAQLLSHPVISGFISGAAMLIIVDQMRPLLGLSVGGDTALHILGAILATAHQASPATAVIGVGALLMMLLARAANRQVKTRRLSQCLSLLSRLLPLILLLLGALVVAVADWQDSVRVIGQLPQGLPVLAWPQWQWPLVRELLFPALIITLVGFVETAAIAQSFARHKRERIDPNAELRGLGWANIAAGLSGAFPVAGSFSRTAVNAEAGARTPLAGILAAALIALVLLFASGLFRALPIAVLAAIIIVAALGLIDLSTLKRNWQHDKAEGLAQLGTTLGVLIAGVEIGIVTGIALSLATLVWRASRPHLAILGRLPDTEHFRNIKHFDVETQPHLLFIRIDENLFFANAEAVESFILRALDRFADTRELVLVMSSVSSIDATALDMLASLNDTLQRRDINLHLAEVKGKVQAQLENDGFPRQLSGELFLSPHKAFEALANE